MLKIRFATLNEQINDLIEFFAQEVSLVEEDKNLRKKVLLLGKNLYFASSPLQVDSTFQ
jgi:hypothetical protein